MGLTVLNVAYVFAPVGLDTAGGAAQVLAALDRALAGEGHCPLVIACAGSKTVGELQGRHAKRDFALALGRICPEKGFHYALDAAALARTPLLIAGRVFPYPDHEQYFAKEIEPRLGPLARFLGNLDFARKRRFLTAARCVLMPSLIDETSSLVAMEAIACGAPG